MRKCPFFGIFGALAALLTWRSIFSFGTILLVLLHDYFCATGSCLCIPSTKARFLSVMGLNPVVHPADIDETELANESPEAMVKRLALEKGSIGGAVAS